ncbi:capsule polysaccharide biosynthesis protein [Ceratocystis lukuohia]|uniref:Capsule polysaccharide biosynthesis protein n=1 Tax=Ceratocystis lukuohia TaxID=2019550 RepID=A0ABR4M9P9_9PEZI
MAADKSTPPLQQKTQAVNGIALVIKAARLILPVVVAGVGYAAWTINWVSLIRHFFLGPGKWSRMALLGFGLMNWKSLPLMWTYRVWKGIIMHSWARSVPPCTPRMLYAPIISPSRVPLLEIDYNLHKSNSTYYSDLDVSRSHLVSYLVKDGMVALANNAQTKIVINSATGAPATGTFGIMLGAAHCSWHREIPPGQKYEVWTRILSWDRKWLYMLTHFVPAGLGRPSEYLDPKSGRVKSKKEPAVGWEKRIYATAVSKYVFKLDRLTIHPSLLLGASGLLPERPGGWKRDELVEVPSEEAINVEPTKSIGDSESSLHSWEWVEWRRQQGMKYASGFLKLDELSSFFEGGQGPAIGVFGPC